MTAQMTALGVRLSDLCPVEPLPGPARCQCSVCGRLTELGHRRRPSANFGAWDLVRGGTFCEWCWAMLKHRPFRQRSWVLTPLGPRFYAGSELVELGAFLRSPVFPCAVYLTTGHRKQAWVVLGRRVSVDPRRLWVATDWAGVVLLDGMDGRPLAVAESLLARGLRRSALLAGRPSPNEWERAIVGGWRAELEEAVERAGDPAWEVWVHVAARSS